MLIHADDFFDHYTPDASLKSEHFIDEGEEGQFETFDKDLRTVRRVYAKTPLRVWTMIDSDDGGISIVNGMRVVNRIAYIITVENGAEGECWRVMD